MKQYEWRIFEDLKLDSNANYINGCCEYCDIVLEKIKKEICQKIDIKPSEISIEQEDWGWILEFQQNGFFYNLSLSYLEDIDGKALNFIAIIEVIQIKKGFFFNRKIESASETDKFAENIKIIAKENMIEVYGQ